MKVSLIIPTFNRCRTLSYNLKCLARQTYPDFEVIVVDDGSEDGTIEMLQKVNTPFNLRVFGFGNPNIYGLRRALNIGILKAENELLLFLDSDMLLAGTALEGHVRTHLFWKEKGEDVVVRGFWIHGVNLRKRFRLNHWNFEHSLRKSKRLQRIYESRNDLNPSDAGSGHLSVQRKHAIAVDGFPGQATCYGADGEFQERLKKMLGLRFVFNPEIFALHGPLKPDIQSESYKPTREQREKLLSGERLGISSLNPDSIKQLR